MYVLDRPIDFVNLGDMIYMYVLCMELGTR